MALRLRRSVRVGVAIILGWLAAPPAAALPQTSIQPAAPPSLFRAELAARSSDGPAEPWVMRARRVSLEPSVFPPVQAADAAGAVPQALRLNLFDDVNLIADLVRIDPILSGFAWVGTVRGVAMSTVTFVWLDGVLAGSVVMPGAAYSIRMARTGGYDVSLVDQTRLPGVSAAAPSSSQTPLPVRDDASGASPEGTAATGVHPTSSAMTDGGIRIDVLAVGLQGALWEAGTAAALAAQVALGISETNTSFANSGIPARLNLVSVEVPALVSVPLYGNDLAMMSSPMNSLGFAVASLREAFGADLVVMITPQYNMSTCGAAQQMTSPSPAFAPFGMSLVSLACISPGFGFGQVIGHNLGAQHDWYADASPGAFPFSHGWVDPARGFVTMMGTFDACVAKGVTCTRLPYWSSPDVISPVEYGAVPIGVAAGTKSDCTSGAWPAQPCDADNRRTLMATAPIVATYRAEVPAAISIASSPASALAGVGDVVTFSAATTTAMPIAVSWQSSDDGGVTWRDLVDGNVYAGTGSTTLAVRVSGRELDGTLYRAVFWSEAARYVTLSAQLSVFAIGVAPNSVTFVATKPEAGSTQMSVEGGAQTIHISMAGRPVAWTIETTAPWTTLSANSGIGDADITLTVGNPGNLGAAVSTYTGSLLVSASGLPGPAVVIPVSLWVSTIPGKATGSRFAGPPTGPATGTVVGTDLSYGGWTFTIVDGVVTLPDCSRYTVIGSGLLLPAERTSACQVQAPMWMALADRTTCALSTSGAVSCWGSNAGGMLGSGPGPMRTRPGGVDGLAAGAWSIAAGATHACAVDSGGGVRCWGLNAFGELGDGSRVNQSVPVGVVGLSSGVGSVAVSANYSCALFYSGVVRCWGSNENGLLGRSAGAYSGVPVDISGLPSSIVTIAAGQSHACGMTRTGGVWCWGANDQGQLGDGTRSASDRPVQVVDLPEPAIKLSAGGFHTCVLLASRSAMCWGANSGGELGTGGLSASGRPAKLSGLDHAVTDISAGANHTCAVTTSGGAVCWGRNYAGQLGDGSAVGRTWPGPVLGLTSGVRRIFAGSLHTCALRIDGTVACWGENSEGAIGDGSTEWRLSPVLVAGFAAPDVRIPRVWWPTPDAVAVGTVLTASMLNATADVPGTFTYSPPAGTVLAESGLTTLRATFVPVDSGAFDVTQAVVVVVVKNPERSPPIISWKSPANAIRGTRLGASQLNATASVQGSFTYEPASGTLLERSGTLTLSVTFVPDDSAAYRPVSSSVSLTVIEPPHEAPAVYWPGPLPVAIGTALSEAQLNATANVPGRMTYWPPAGTVMTAAGTRELWAVFVPDDEMAFFSSVVRVALTVVPAAIPMRASRLARGYGLPCVAVESGGVKCWGQSPVAVDGIPGTVVSLATGEFGPCAVDADGGLYCWSSQIPTQSPRAVRQNGFASRVTGVAVGQHHACAVDEAGVVFCWGSNYYGELGAGVTSFSSSVTPRPVIGLPEAIRSVVAGQAHTCALSVSGSVYCWGGGFAGALGNGGSADSGVPVRVAALGSSVASLTSGGYSACALLTWGEVRCWGSGVLGDGATTKSVVPISVAGLESGVTAIAAGTTGACAIKAGGSVLCWGSNSNGEIGDGTTMTRSVPVQVTGLTSAATDVAVFGTLACALTVAEGVQCWGGDSTNVRGLGGRPSESGSLFTQVRTGIGLTLAAWNRSFGCGVTDGSQLKCWGDNSSGQLGDGSLASREDPAPVSGFDWGGGQLALGPSFACATDTVGRLWCWGGNSTGQLGDGTQAARLTPVLVAAVGTGVRSVSADTGYYRPGKTTSFQSATCVVRASGGVMCWGSNVLGQLGRQAQSTFQLPAYVDGLESGYVSVVVGGTHACALHQDGHVMCWGAGFGSKPVPMAPPPGVIRAIATGSVAGVYALMENGAVYRLARGTPEYSCYWMTPETAAVPVPEFARRHVEAIAVSDAAVCGVDDTNQVLCLASGSATGYTTVNLPSAAVSLGTSCALLDYGGIECWGTPAVWPQTAPRRIYGLGGAVRVDAIAPPVGRTAGGTRVVVSGAYFLAGASVTVGGEQATDVRVGDDGVLTAVVPRHAAGRVDVVVTNPDTVSATLTSGFLYSDVAAADRHPADTDGDGRLSIAEVTAYGSAWKKGLPWGSDPSAIDIGYVTRAGYLWRNGETYQKTAGACPACWVPRQADAPPVPIR